MSVEHMVIGCLYPMMEEVRMRGKVEAENPAQGWSEALATF